MNVTVSDLSPVERKLEFTIPADKVTKALDKAYDKVKKKARIKGFRPGKVPRSLLESYYGSQVKQDVTVALVQEHFEKAVAEHSLIPVGQPAIDNQDLKEGEDFQFSIQIEVVPPIENIEGYEDIELEGREVEVSEENVEDQLTQLQQMHARAEALEEDRPAQEGDYLVIDYEGKIDGAPFKGGTAKDFSIVIGSGTLIPGFEEELVGMDKAQEKEFSLKFPDKYMVGDLTGKEVVFNVKVKDIKERVLPSLDDEFAKECGDYTGLDDLKNKIREGIQKEEERKTKGEHHREILKQLIEKNPLEIPGSLVEEEARYLASRRRGAYGAADDPASGDSAPAVQEEDRVVALEEVHGRLLLDSLAQSKDIQIADEELSERLEIIAQGIQQPTQAIIEFYKKENRMESLRDGLKREKTLDFILQKAKIKTK